MDKNSEINKNSTETVAEIAERPLEANSGDINFWGRIVKALADNNLPLSFERFLRTDEEPTQQSAQEENLVNTSQTVDPRNKEKDGQSEKLLAELRTISMEIDGLIARARNLIFRSYTDNSHRTLDVKLRYYVRKLQNLQNEMQNICVNIEHLKLQIAAIKFSINMQKKEKKALVSEEIKLKKQLALERKGTETESIINTSHIETEFVDERVSLGTVRTTKVTFSGPAQKKTKKTKRKMITENDVTLELFPLEENSANSSTVVHSPTPSTSVANISWRSNGTTQSNTSRVALFPYDSKDHLDDLD